MTPAKQSGHVRTPGGPKKLVFWLVAVSVLTALSLLVFWGWEFRGPLGFAAAILFAIGFSFFGYLSLLFLFYALVLLLLPIGLLRFRWRMHAKRRHKHWRRLAKECEGSRGTIIVDNPTLGWRTTNAWWTQEDVLGQAPCTKWSSKDDFLNRTEPHPFEKWCFDNYTSPDTGRAILFGVWNGNRRAKRLAERLGPGVQVVETWSGSLGMPFDRIREHAAKQTVGDSASDAAASPSPE